MRDPSRIPLILDAVERAWQETPEQRLGQLLCNITRGMDLFYVEDGRLLEEIRLQCIELNEEEEAYIQREPEERREGWSEFFRMAEDRFGFEG